MSLILISIFSLLLLFISLSFNCYVLISLLSKENLDTKPFKVGLAAVVGFISTVIILKGELFQRFPPALLIYGAFSGLTYGIYRQVKRYRRGNAKTLAMINSKTSNSSASFGISIRSTFQLLMFTFLGLTATYFLIRILAFLVGKTFTSLVFQL